MAREDRGMRLSTRGLELTGEQVVKVESSRGRDEVFKLDGGAITSYTYNPLSDNGFTQNTSIDAFNAKVVDGNYLLGTENIMEIAGGVDTFKVRYDNGLCLIGTRTYSGEFLISQKNDIARITKNEEYSVLQNKFYKTGAGTAPLMALLDGEILAVFEGKDSDYKVTVADAIANAGNGAIVGVVGSFTVFSQNGSLKIVTPSGAVAIDGYGTIVRKVDATREIKLGTQIPSNADKKVDYSGRFSADHYAYIQLHRNDFKNCWAGVGNVGYVVDMGDYAQMRVPISGESVVGGETLTATGTLDDEIDFVIVGGVFKKVDGTNLVDMPQFTSDGQPLIDHIYHTDMSTEVAMATGNKEVEPFSVNGYFFGYGAGHLVDVDPSTV